MDWDVDYAYDDEKNPFRRDSGMKVRREMEVFKDLREAHEVLTNDGRVAYVIVDGIDSPLTRSNIRQYLNRYGMEEEESMNMQMDPEFLRSEAERMLQRAAILEQVPQSDTFEDGQVLTFQKNYSGTQYKYAAIKVEGLWHVTGAKAPNGVYWNELVTFIGVNNLPTVGVMIAKGSLFDYVKGIKAELSVAVVEDKKPQPLSNKKPLNNIRDEEIK